MTDLNEAIKTLRAHGYALNSHTLARMRRKKVSVTRNDIRKFHKWVHWSYKTGGRFVVAVSGRVGNRVTFHSMDGYKQRVKHGQSIGGKNRLEPKKAQVK